MTDPTTSLERELAAMPPRRLPPELLARIESSFAAPQSPPRRDRLLACAMGFGALAASLIAVMLLMDLRSVASSPIPADAVATSPQTGDAPQAVAWADRRLQLTTLLENP